MSWGATGYTPIVTYNEPPFGFHEVIQPADYERCNQNPYIATDLLKMRLNKKFENLMEDDDDDVQPTHTNCCNEWPLRETFELSKGKESVTKINWILVLFVLGLMYYFSTAT